MAAKQIFGVLSGDIVGSSDIHQRTGLPTMSVIKRIGERVIDNFPDAVIPEIDIYRGDSWQMVCLDPGLSLRIGLFFRALIKADRRIQPADSRLSIGYGEIDFLPEQGISAGDGVAYRLSGGGLDRCGKRRRMCLVFPEEKSSRLTSALDQMVRLIDFQVQRWQPGQSEAVAGALLGLTQQNIGQEWVKDPVTQQTISQHLESAGWQAINSALDYFEATLSEVLSV